MILTPPSPPEGLRRARTRGAGGLLLHRMPCHRSTQWGPDRITLGLRSDPIWSQRTSCPIGSARSWSTCVQCAYLVGCTLAQIGSPRMEWSPRCFHVLAMSLLHSLAHFLIPHVRCASSLCFSLLPCSLLVCDLLCASIISASLLSVSYIGTSSCYALFMSPPKAPSLSARKPTRTVGDLVENSLMLARPGLGPSGFPLSSVLTREAIQAYMP